jgi:hypothetical protein
MFTSTRKKAALEAFADTLVSNFVKRFPPEAQVSLGGTKAKTGRQLGNAVNEFERGVVAFQQEQRLGIYGKAQLLNRIKWQLKERAYSEEFIDATMTTLARFLNVRK